MAAAGLSLSSALSGLSLCHSLGSSYAVGESRLPQQARPGVGEVKLPGLTIEAAHKKGSGSTKNGRDSNPKFLGVKIYGDQPAQPGAIIVRQRGTKFHPGKNVGLGRDYTIFSKINGLVKFEKLGPDRKQISVYPITEEKVENPDSRKVRKREWFRQIREKKRAKLEAEYGTFEIPIEFGIASAESEESPETTVIC